MEQYGFSHNNQMKYAHIANHRTNEKQETCNNVCDNEQKFKIIVR